MRRGGSKIQHHVPVADAITRLAVQPGQVWVDYALGFAGHTRLLLDCGAQVIGIDQDHDARSRAEASLKAVGPRVRVIDGNFGDLASVLDRLDVDAVDGILADIGVSSYQLDQPQRGFLSA